MTKKKRYLIILAFIIVILVVGIFFVYSLTRRTPTTDTKLTPEGEVSQTITNPEVIDNSDDGSTSPKTETTTTNSGQIQPTDEMKKVISDNKNDVNNSEVMDQITQSYPSDVIPLYKAKTAADSNDIVTANGKPGWIAQYGSDATVPEICDFYKSLLSSTSGYKASEDGDARIYEGTVDNCYVKVTVAPNNPERTGLNDMCNVDVYIERN